MAENDIIFSCAECGTQLAVAAELAGVEGPCPACYAQIKAPEVLTKVPEPNLPPMPMSEGHLFPKVIGVPRQAEIDFGFDDLVGGEVLDTKVDAVPHVAKELPALVDEQRKRVPPVLALEPMPEPEVIDSKPEPQVSERSLGGLPDIWIKDDPEPSTWYAKPWVWGMVAVVVAMTILLVDVFKATKEPVPGAVMPARPGSTAELKTPEPVVPKPEIVKPEIAKPEIVKPEIAKPEIAKPEIAKPEIAKPEIAKPEIVKPEIVKPEIPKPEIAKPEIAKPEIAKPEIAKPEIAKPEIAKPEIAKPEIPKPEIPKPEIVKPEIAKPEIPKVDPAAAPVLVKLKTSPPKTVPDEKVIVPVEKVIEPLAVLPPVEGPPEEIIQVKPKSAARLAIEERLPGLDAQQVLDLFLNVKTLDERLPLLLSKTATDELEQSCLAKPLPPVTRSQLEYRDVSSETGVADSYFTVLFHGSASATHPQTLLVRQQGEEPPKVVVDPFLDLYGGRLTAFAAKPVQSAKTFEVYVSALAHCKDPEVPGHQSKMTLSLQARDHGAELAKAYFDKKSRIAELLEDGTFRLSYGHPIPCRVLLKWNASEKPGSPYLEAVEITAFGWGVE